MSEKFISLSGKADTTPKHDIVRWSKGVVIVGKIISVEEHVSFIPSNPRGEVTGFYTPKHTALRSKFVVLDVEGKKRIMFIQPGLELATQLPINTVIKVECEGERFIPVLGGKGCYFNLMYDEDTVDTAFDINSIV